MPLEGYSQLLKWMGMGQQPAPTPQPQPQYLPPPSPQEIGRLQLQKLREQAATQVLGPGRVTATGAPISGYEGPSPQQLATQGPYLAKPPSMLTQIGQGFRKVFPLEPVDPETGMPNVDVAMGAGAAGEAAGNLTKRILKRADIRKGLEFASEAERSHWDDFLKGWSEDSVDGFITEGGSSYRIAEGGTTIRNKAKHAFHDPKDVGIKPRSTATFYATPNDARAIADFGAVTYPIKGTNQNLSKRISSVGDTLELKLLHPSGASKTINTVQVTSKPQVGLSPIELWGDRKWHAGTPITEIKAGLLPQEAIPFSKVQEAAAEIDPALARRVMSAKPKDPIRDPAIFQHARERVNSINSTILKMSEQLKADLPALEKAKIQGQIAVLEKDAKGTLDWIFRTGSEHGRNLAYHRMMAGQTFDDTYWLNRARRLSGGSLPDATHREIIEALAKGRAAQAGGDQAGTEAAKVALAQALTKTEKSTIWETISAVRKAGLLTGVKTSLRNLGGNASMAALEETARVPASIIDSVISVFSGQRSVSAGRGIGAAAWEGATKGLQEAKQIMKQGATTADLLKMDLPRELNSGSKVFDTYTKYVFRAMSAQDRPFRAYAFRRSLEEQARTAAITMRREGQLGKLSIDQMTKQLMENPSEEMLQQAIAYSEFSVFSNKTEMTDAVRRGMAALSPGKRAAVDMFIPFKTTPANVISRVVEYSGGGVVKGAALSGKAAYGAKIAGKAFTPQQQREISMAFGRGLVGPALIYMGWKLAESGQMSGMTPETPGERATMEEAGRLPGALRIGDSWQQVASISPIGNLLTIGATIYEQETKPKASTLPAAVGVAGLRTVAEQPFLSGMEDITGALQSTSNLGDTAERMGQRMFGSFVPTLAADLARASDPYRRETRGQGWLASAKERTPLRTSLPTRRGVLGAPLEQSPSAWWNPGIGSKAKELSDPVRRELVQNRVSVSWPGKKDYETPNEYRARAALTGDQIEKQIAALIQEDDYRSANRDVRRLMIEQRINQVRRLISDELNANNFESVQERVARLKELLQSAGVK